MEMFVIVFYGKYSLAIISCLNINFSLEFS